MSEASAIEAMVEDGVITTSEDEKLARNFQSIFRLSEGGGWRAVAGRDCARRRPASQIAGRSASPKPGDNERLIMIIEQWQQDLLARGQLCIERGETRELAALWDAFGKVLNATQNILQAGWVIRVAEGVGRSLRPARVRAVAASAARLLAGPVGGSTSSDSVSVGVNVTSPGY